MDASAMDDHDWDDCGEAIARLFNADQIKHRAICAAWYDQDECDQIDIHGVLCEENRNPDLLAKAHQFERLAHDYERRFRMEEAAREARESRATAERTDLGRAANAEYEKFQALLKEHVRLKSDDVKDVAW